MKGKWIGIVKREERRRKSWVRARVSVWQYGVLLITGSYLFSNRSCARLAFNYFTASTLNVIYVSACLSICLSIDLTVYLAIYLSTHPSIYLSVYPSIYLINCLSISLLVYLYVYMPVYLPMPAHFSIYPCVCVCLCGVCVSLFWLYKFHLQITHFIYVIK